ncbi:hypothetical protein O181_101798 [Austropuccinia psidii MF-1]|uniref:Uncharacterized protein n=1 Tax=Austropuccinia psidii MF-1 TaxID=1389203 RepID=A0A9Q3PHH8_9BASI|nr:hypothetical protein [Austropuccinia psidii MF-1]
MSLHPRRIQYSKNIFSSPKQKGDKKIQPANKAIKQERTSEKESDINKNEDPIKQKPKDSTNTRNNIENHPQSNGICSSKYIKKSTNAKEEDSTTPYQHPNRENQNLNLGINYFSLDKAKEN